MLKKIVVGWLLIAGMVAYTLLAGCKQIYDWVTAKTWGGTSDSAGDNSEHQHSKNTNKTTGKSTEYQ